MRGLRAWVATASRGRMHSSPIKATRLPLRAARGKVAISGAQRLPLAAVLFACLQAGSASAMPDQPIAAVPSEPEAQCEKALITASQRHGVPTRILSAIAEVETGRATRDGRVRPWPWAVNIEGRGHWARSRSDARDLALQALERGIRSIDLGCFQINYRWHGHAFPSIEAMLAPDANADYAARLLRGLHERHGNWPDAAAAYHSATPGPARRYLTRVSAALARAGADMPWNMPAPDMTVPSPQPDVLTRRGIAGEERRHQTLTPGIAAPGPGSLHPAAFARPDGMRAPPGTPGALVMSAFAADGGR